MPNDRVRPDVSSLDSAKADELSCVTKLMSSHHDGRECLTKDLIMLPDHEVEGIIPDALTKAGVEPPAGGEVGQIGSLNDVARAIMDALADAGITLVKQ